MKKEKILIEEEVIVKKYDVVVIGGGLAGVCAAIAASRMGVKTALICDRPVLGGNSSAEIKVDIGGADCKGKYRYSRETGIIDELISESANFPNPFFSKSIWSLVLWAKCKDEKNLELFLNTIGKKPEVKNNVIQSILAEQFTTGKIYKICGKIFIDCTGDGRIGYESGAKYMYGRESKYKWNEDLAFEKSDKYTMGNTLFIQAKNFGSPIPFNPPKWAYDFPKEEDFPGYDPEFGHRDCPHELQKLLNGDGGYWWIEFGGMMDTIKNAEFIRDELIKYAIGVWDHIKNHGDHKAENYIIDSINPLPGKRESRRFIGDYILTQNDLENLEIFPDAIGYGGWFIDLHYPHGITGKGKRYWYGRFLKGRYSIPFRCLYSSNIKNLLFAGRNISVSHIALGSTRVMGTCAILGQAAGVAASLCKKYKCFPRDIYKFHIKKLQQELLKQDCYIPTIKNEDDNDLALKGKIKVSSVKKLEFPKPEKYEKTDLGLAQSFVISANIKKIILYLENKSKKSVIGKIHLRKSEFIDDFRNEKDIAVIESIIKPGISKVEFPLPELNLEINRPYWIFLEGNKDLYWGYSSIEPIGTCAGKMTNGWTVSEFLKDTTLAITRIRGTFCLELSPEMFPYNGEQVISGITRPEKSTNLWISDKGFPQWIEIYWDKVVEFNVLHLTFDNNLDREVKEIHRLRIPPELVKEYDVFVEKEGQEMKILSVKDNYLRKRVHFFEEKIKTRRLKIVILKTNGIEEARIYEIRVYNIKKKNF